MKKTSLFILIVVLVFLPKEGKVSRTYIESISLEQMVEMSFVIIVGTKIEEKQIKQTAKFDIGKSKMAKAKYDVDITTYKVDEILWKKTDIDSYSLDVQKKVKSIRKNKIIKVFDSEAVKSAYESARYEAGAGSKSYSKDIYNWDVKIEDENSQEQKQVILFLNVNRFIDKAWSLACGNAVENISKKKDVLEMIGSK